MKELRREVFSAGSPEGVLKRPALMARMPQYHGRFSAGLPGAALKDPALMVRLSGHPGRFSAESPGGTLESPVPLGGDYAAVTDCSWTAHSGIKATGNSLIGAGKFLVAVIVVMIVMLRFAGITACAEADASKIFLSGAYDSQGSWIDGSVAVAYAIRDGSDYYVITRLSDAKSDGAVGCAVWNTQEGHVIPINYGQEYESFDIITGEFADEIPDDDQVFEAGYAHQGEAELWFYNYSDMEARSCGIVLNDAEYTDEDVMLISFELTDSSVDVTGMVPMAVVDADQKLVAFLVPDTYKMISLFSDTEEFYNPSEASEDRYENNSDNDDGTGAGNENQPVEEGSGTAEGSAGNGVSANMEENNSETGSNGGSQETDSGGTSGDGQETDSGGTSGDGQEADSGGTSGGDQGKGGDMGSVRDNSSGQESTDGGMAAGINPDGASRTDDPSESGMQGDGSRDTDDTFERDTVSVDGPGNDAGHHGESAEYGFIPVLIICAVAAAGFVIVRSRSRGRQRGRDRGQGNSNPVGSAGAKGSGGSAVSGGGDASYGNEAASGQEPGRRKNLIIGLAAVIAVLLVITVSMAVRRSLEEPEQDLMVSQGAADGSAEGSVGAGGAGLVEGEAPDGNTAASQGSSDGAGDGGRDAAVGTPDMTGGQEADGGSDSTSAGAEDGGSDGTSDGASDEDFSGSPDKAAADGGESVESSGSYGASEDAASELNLGLTDIFLKSMGLDTEEAALSYEGEALKHADWYTVDGGLKQSASFENGVITGFEAYNAQTGSLDYYTEFDYREDLELVLAERHYSDADEGAEFRICAYLAEIDVYGCTVHSGESSETCVKYLYEQYSPEGVYQGGNEYREDGSIFRTHTADEKGRVVLTTYYNSEGIADSHYSYEYDEDGRLVRDGRYYPDGSPDYLYLYEYDEYGNKTGTYRYGSNSSLTDYTVYEYNSDGSRRTKEVYTADGTMQGAYAYEYYSDGRLMYMMSYNGDGEKELLTKYDTYNGEEVVTREVSIESDGSGGDYSSYEYDTFCGEVVTDKCSRYTVDGVLTGYTLYEYRVSAGFVELAVETEYDANDNIINTSDYR